MRRLRTCSNAEPEGRAASSSGKSAGFIPGSSRVYEEAAAEVAAAAAAVFTGVEATEVLYKLRVFDNMRI